MFPAQGCAKFSAARLFRWRAGGAGNIKKAPSRRVLQCGPWLLKILGDLHRQACGQYARSEAQSQCQQATQQANTMRIDSNVYPSEGVAPVISSQHLGEMLNDGADLRCLSVSQVPIGYDMERLGTKVQKLDKHMRGLAAMGDACTKA